MNEYHKINSIYLRDPATNHKTFLLGQCSLVADTPIVAEGLVLRPEKELRDRMGRRIITKIKHRDFK